jgi:drug/metabolite transporter (DMT)-like permease
VDATARHHGRTLSARPTVLSHRLVTLAAKHSRCPDTRTPGRPALRYGSHAVHLSVFHTSIAVAIFGCYLVNLLSSLTVGVVRHHEAFDRATAAAFGSSVFVVVFVALGQNGNHASHGDWTGFPVAVLSGLCATAIAQEQKRLARSFDAETITFAQVAGGVAFCWVALIIVGDYSFTKLSIAGLLLAVLYGFMFWACHRLMAFGFRDGPIGIGTVLLSVEVVIGPLLAWVAFHETLTSLELIGGAFTAAAIVAAAKRSPTEEALRETARAN